MHLHELTRPCLLDGVIPLPSLTLPRICLPWQECGLLEWVNDTSTLRSLIIESHTTLSDTRDFPLPDIQQFHVEFANQQVEKQKDIGALIQMYNFFVGEYRPCLHRWFLDKFQVSTTTRSVSLMKTPLFATYHFP